MRKRVPRRSPPREHPHSLNAKDQVYPHLDSRSGQIRTTRNQESTFPQNQMKLFTFCTRRPRTPMTTRLCPQAVHAAKRSLCRTVHINAVAGPSRPSSFGPSRRNFGSIARRKSVKLAQGIRSYHYYTDVERGHERIIKTATSRVEEFDKASEAVSPFLTMSKSSSDK